MALPSFKKKDDAANGAAPAPAKPAKVVKERRAKPPRPVVKNGTVVGLNIGNALIKAVEVTAKNGQLSVTRIASIPTPPDAYQNGNVLSISALSNAIKALWKSGGFKGRAVISSVAGTGALVVRVIEVPQMSDSQLEDAMKADAQLYIPFPPTEVQMDFKALRDLPTDPDANTMDVLLAAAQSEIIDLHIKTLQNARLDPRAVDVEPIASGRALSLLKRAESAGAPPDYSEISAIANIGAYGTEISLLRGDVLVFTRTVTAGGNSLSQIVADTLGVPFSEGERLKIERGDALPPEGYQAGQADEFGFNDDFSAGGEFGGFDDFGLGGGAPSAPANATTVLEAPAQNATDPFDLDFFNQGPKNEPGAGHGQKEGEPPAGGAPRSNTGAFSFDDTSLLPEPANAPEGASQVPTFSFDFDLPPQDLPAASDVTPQTSVARAEAQPQPQPQTETQTSGPSSSPTFQASLADADELFSIPATTPTPSASAPTPSPSAAAPSVSAPAPATSASSEGKAERSSALIPSAFDFSDFDLPAVVTEPSAASAPAPAPTPAANDIFSFNDTSDLLPANPQVKARDLDFGEPFAAPVAASEAAPVAQEFLPDEPAPGVTVPPATTFVDPFAVPDEPATAPATGAQPDGFDLSSVFGEEAAPQATAQFGEPVQTSASPGLGVEGLNLGGDDFGFGAPDDSISDFGAGLSGGADADATALYNALAQGLEELSSEIQRSLSFYLERVPDAALSRIYLTGGGAMMRNLDVYLTQRLGAPTSVFNPLQLLPLSSTAAGHAPIGPLYAVALGLGLRDFVD